MARTSLLSIRLGFSLSSVYNFATAFSTFSICLAELERARYANANLNKAAVESGSVHLQLLHLRAGHTYSLANGCRVFVSRR